MTSIKRILENWHFTWDDVQLNIPEGKELCLDMGCGDGRHRYLIEKAGWHWIGLDIDAERGGAILVGDGMQLPFLDESLEIVLLMQVLEHLPQPWKVLNNVNCVLKPGGWIVGSVSCMEPLHDVSSYFGFTHKGLKQMLADCGFVDIKIRPGINAFSLIMRSWFRHLLGSKWGERIAFLLVRASFISLLVVYLFLRGAWNFLRRGRLGADYKQTVRWLGENAPLEFAGHLTFIARKAG